MTQEKQKITKPPKLLRGLFSLTVAITSAILFVGWAVTHYQVEQLVATRTSEYAHSIAQIAANSSADALLSGDRLQLKMLVENVAKDPYIRSATVYAEDGQIVAQHPEEVPEKPQALINDNLLSGEQPPSPTDSLDVQAEVDLAALNEDAALLIPGEQNLSKKAQAYIQAQDDIPFIEKIVYQDVTAGWFKISLNRHLLESSFRESLQFSQNVIAVFAGLLIIVLFFILARYDKKVKSLVNTCHRLIQVNAVELPKVKSQWMSSLQELSETRFQSLVEHPTQLPQQQAQWFNSQRISNTFFCYCEFNLQQLEHEQAASCLTQAEKYLQAAVQAHGVQSQGDILSGSLIPFLESHDAEEALIEILSLIHTVQSCLAQLEVTIVMRAYIAQGTVLVLENERGVINGVSLSSRLLDKFYKLAPIVKSGDTICVAFEQEQLSPLGEFEQIELANNLTKTPLFKLKTLSESIKQQSQRQISYIMANNRLS